MCHRGHFDRLRDRFYPLDWTELNTGLSDFFPKAFIPCIYFALIASNLSACAADIFPDALDNVFLSDESSASSDPNDSI